ncbi:Transposon Tf2-9 polyprotein [Thelohanellus kitauei]|uniref:Transposon Tf2-9 polyprotein n=1 Tax=Thelohanellus kitauei TaxID=669202 RepID=A0A0C2MZH4_THEKT|nr:Transposon Tf2-9 polyprotein [Thelohanellus kitauei]
MGTLLRLAHDLVLLLQMATKEPDTGEHKHRNTEDRDKMLDLAKSFKFDNFDKTKESWTVYKRRFEHAFKMHTGFEGSTGLQLKKDLFLNSVGSRDFQLVMENFPEVDIDLLTCQQVMEFMSSRYDKPRNGLYERFTFGNTRRNANESPKEFADRLKDSARFCEFGTTFDQRVRDQFLLGFGDKNIQKELLRIFSRTDALLEDILHEATMISDAEKNADAFQVKPDFLEKNGFPDEVNRVEKTRTTTHNCRILDPNRDCLRCGKRKHRAPQVCPALTLECKACKMVGHFSAACLKSGNAQIGDDKKQVRTVNVDDSVFQFYDENFSQVISKNFMIPLLMNGVKVKMLADSGATVSCIGQTLWKKIGAPKLRWAPPLKGYTNNTIEIKGRTNVNVKIASKDTYLPVIVTAKDDTPILGTDWMDRLKIGLTINKINERTSETSNKELKRIVEEYSDVFKPNNQGITPYKASILLADGALPKIHRPRRVPYALRDRIESELKRLTSEGRLEKINIAESPAAWACPTVNIVKKDGSLRICGDFRCTVNPWINVPPYPFPTLEDILDKIQGGVKFTVLDLKEAYLQLPLDEQSKNCCGISTHLGFFRYTRLPFGISSAPATFQAVMDEILKGIPFTTCFIDDIIISGKDDDEHLKNLTEVLKRLSTHNISTKLEKCQFMKSKVSYMGHTLDAEGIHPQEDNIKSIRNQRTPTNITQLKSFLGAVTYYSRFIPSLHPRCRALYDLTKKGQTWKWEKRHQDVFNEIKNTISSHDTLQLFNPEQQIIITTDASNDGIGAVLLQKDQNEIERPVMHVSRTLKKAENNYSTTEKEALAIIYALILVQKYETREHTKVTI